jgi:Glycosyltransferase family 87
MTLPFRPAFILRPSFWCLLLGVVGSLRILFSPESHTVFPIFAGGSAHWWSDIPLYLTYKPLDYFRYPPTFAIAFTPFYWLGPRLGGITWAWVSLGVYFFGLRAAWRNILPGRWESEQTGPFVLLALLGALPGLWNGQSNAFFVGLLLLGTSAALDRRWWTAAVCLSLTVVLKLTPLPLVLLVCCFWPRQLLGRIACCVLIGVVLPFLTRPPEMVVAQYQGLVDHLAGSSSARWPGFRDGWTVWVVLRHLFSGGAGLPDLVAPMEGNWYRVLQVLGGLGVLAWSLLLKRRGVDERMRLTLVLAAGAGWLLLLGPAAEYPTFAFLAPFLAWGLVQRHSWRGRLLIEAAGVCVLLLGWSSLTRPFWDLAPWLILSLPLGTCLFLAWVVSIGLKESALIATPKPLAYRGDAMLSFPEFFSCPNESSFSPPRSGRDTCVPPRPSNSPSGRRSPMLKSKTSTS